LYVGGKLVFSARIMVRQPHAARRFLPAGGKSNHIAQRVLPVAEIPAMQVDIVVSMEERCRVHIFLSDADYIYSCDWQEDFSDHIQTKTSGDSELKPGHEFMTTINNDTSEGRNLIYVSRIMKLVGVRIH